MSSCNNNSRCTRIVVSQPCDPCNPCNSCHRCSCDCTCNEPDYDTAGCLTILPSDCIKYVGPNIADQHIVTDDLLTKVIQNICASINGTTFLAPRPSFLGGISSSEEVSTSVVNVSQEEITAMNEAAMADFRTQFDYRAQGLENKVEHINDRLKKEGTIHSLKTENDGIIEASLKGKTLNTNINMENFFEAFQEFVKSSPENISKMVQFLDYLKNSTDFVLYPYSINATTKDNLITITWSKVDDVNSYSVFYKVVSDGDFVKAGETPALGMTIPNLQSNTEYQLYLVSTGTNGNESASSPIITIKTN